MIFSKLFKTIAYYGPENCQNRLDDGLYDPKNESDELISGHEYQMETDIDSRRKSKRSKDANHEVILYL